MADLLSPDIKGIYELQLPLDFRAVVTLGCLAGVERGKARPAGQAGQGHRHLLAVLAVV
jgi:hypothetical protein